MVAGSGIIGVMRVLRGAVVALLLAPVPALAAEIWVVRDEDGNLIFTDTFEAGAIAVNLRDPPNINPNLDFAEQERKYDALILRYSRKYRIDPFLVKAVIRTESLFDPDAISDAGAQGLMQLMPATAERFRVTDMLDPEQNIRAGTEYLRFLLDLFKGDVKLAVASYNCGENLVQRMGRVPGIPETEDYVVKVENARREYRLRGLSSTTVIRR